MADEGQLVAEVRAYATEHGLSIHAQYRPVGRTNHISCTSREAVTVRAAVRPFGDRSPDNPEHVGPAAATSIDTVSVRVSDELSQCPGLSVHSEA